MASAARVASSNVFVRTMASRRLVGLGRLLFWTGVAVVLACVVEEREGDQHIRAGASYVGEPGRLHRRHAERRGRAAEERAKAFVPQST